jgi:hypothetical protein
MVIDNIIASKPEESELNQLKKMHDYNATVAHVLKTKQFYFEEFQGIIEMIGFFDGMAKELKKKIELLEPPKPKLAPNEQTQ